MKKQTKYFLSFCLTLIIYINTSFSQGPGEPIHPMTAPGANGIARYNHLLFWENPTGTVYNKIYFSDDSSLVANLDTSVMIYNGFPSTVYTSVSLNIVGLLDNATKYYWRIAEFDSSTFTLGDVWHFITKGQYPYIDDNFSNGLENWTAIGPQGFNNWNISHTSNAGGSMPELEFSSYPMFVGDSYLMLNYAYDSQPSYHINFNHFVAWFSNSFTVGIRYTTDEGSTWIPLWEISPTGNVGPANIFLTMPNENNVQLAFYFSGDSYNISGWYIDDFSINGPITPSLPPSFLQAKADTSYLQVNLNWDSGFSGGSIYGYRIQRKDSLPNSSSDYTNLIDTDDSTFWYSDYTVLSNETYTYRIQTLVGSGQSVSSWSNEATAYTPDIITFSENKSNSVLEFTLYQNYPNPFNPTTKIKYEIATSSFVTLIVYDVLGNEAATLVKEDKLAGSYEVEFNSFGLSSGVYFYRLQAGSIVDTKKLIIIK